MRLLDLSHTVSHGLVTYPGLPAPVISMVGIDSVNIDATSPRGDRPGHTLLPD